MTMTRNGKESKARSRPGWARGAVDSGLVLDLAEAFP
jgi:hypothetical protein